MCTVLSYSIREALETLHLLLIYEGSCSFNVDVCNWHDRHHILEKNGPELTSHVVLNDHNVFFH